MSTRREFLGAVTGPGLVAMAALRDGGVDRILALSQEVQHLSPEEVAEDEDFWRGIQSAFTVDRNLVNLNNGGVCPSPRVVQEAMRRYLEISQAAPAYTMWRWLEPQREVIRERLARVFGCDGEELAITRNASESLETLILGLPLQPGDEAVVSNQNYPRMLTTWKQRARREGIVLKTFSLPVAPADPAELIEAYRRQITPKTRIMEVCHVINWNGQIMPVREICQLGRERGIDVIVDGAHAFAHFPFQREDLDCDFYGTSLHKWLCAPHGTGFLYVRRERIKDVWPLMGAAAEQDGDIRKFEEIGTHPAANHNAIGEALTFHQGIGVARKAARLRYLHHYWMSKLKKHERVSVRPRDEPRHACGLRLLTIEGLEPTALSAHLLKRYHMATCPIRHEDFQGLRITPQVYTTLEELDRFVAAVETVLRCGLPG